VGRGLLKSSSGDFYKNQEDEWRKAMEIIQRDERNEFAFVYKDRDKSLSGEKGSRWLPL